MNCLRCSLPSVGYSLNVIIHKVRSFSCKFGSGCLPVGKGSSAKGDSLFYGNNFKPRIFYY